MRLSELEPRFLCTTQGRYGMGLGFLCPVCRKLRVTVWFANPLDRHPPRAGVEHWERTGSTFADITLTPSIDGSVAGARSCRDAPDPLEASHWHGHVTNGEIVGGL